MMTQDKTVAAFSLFLALILAAAVLAAPPRWPSGGANAGEASKRSTSMPPSFHVQCPVAYSGINGDMLPTGWETTMDKGQPAVLITSQVQGQYLYCAYQIPSTGRDIHASVRKLVPGEYRCETDGAGRFDCRK